MGEWRLRDPQNGLCSSQVNTAFPPAVMAECLLPPSSEMKAMLAATSVCRESSARVASSEGEKPAGGGCRRHTLVWRGPLLGVSSLNVAYGDVA